MKFLIVVVFFLALSPIGFAQGPAQKIYETERAFEKTVAEKGMRAGFLEYMAPVSVMFVPEAANAIETWKARPATPAALTWNPILIDVSSNELLAYSVGNSIFKPKGKDDTTEYHGHYLSVWSRQPDGSYRAVLDTGINHEKPATIPTTWKSPTAVPGTGKERKTFAADASLRFYEMVESVGAAKAYKAFLADDAILMRDGKQPFFGKKSALDHLEDQQHPVKFAKRKSFLESADLAYVYNLYAKVDKADKEVERGNFVQVWKRIGGRWMIVLDAFIPIATK